MEAPQTIIARLYVGRKSEKHATMEKQMFMTDEGPEERIVPVPKVYSPEEVTKIVSRYFTGATQDEALGLWEGKQEPSSVVEIINCCAWEEPPVTFWEKIEKLVGDLTYELGQSVVIVERFTPHLLRAKEIYYDEAKEAIEEGKPLGIMSEFSETEF